MRCPICSSPLTDGATKCDECGCGILPPPPTGVEPTPFVRPASTPKWPLVLSIIGVVAALAVIAVALFPLFDEDDDGTVQTATTEVNGTEATGPNDATTTTPATTAPASTTASTSSPATTEAAGTGGSSVAPSSTTNSATTRPPTTTAVEFPAPLAVARVAATCTAPDSTDSRGNPITFEAALTIDGLPDTAWRCPGASIRQALLYTLASPSDITALAALPGYAGSDPFNNVDRFDQNRRVLKARWACLDEGGNETGTAEQTFNANRALQGITVNFAECSELVFEILESSAPGNRDYTAVSEIGIYGPSA